MAIFVIGIGLLALLTLFPLGALEMAEAIKDDRTGAAASNAAMLSDVAKDLLSRTGEFAIESLSKGAVDPQAMAQLLEEYEDLALRVDRMEVELEELQALFPRPLVQRHVAPLLAQLRSIKHRISALVRLLSLVRERP